MLRYVSLPPSKIDNFDSVGWRFRKQFKNDSSRSVKGSISAPAVRFLLWVHTSLKNLVATNC
jgi:hypothetical protein